MSISVSYLKSETNETQQWAFLLEVYLLEKYYCYCYCFHLLTLTLDDNLLIDYRVKSSYS